MAIRNIVKGEDEILRKKSRKVDVIDKKILTLLQDMRETLVAADGVGLAAPQVAVLKRVAIIDVGEGVIELINPEIISTSGSQCGAEGCLSFPGVFGEVTRPDHVVVKAQNRFGEVVKIEGTGLLARALCHEIDHLDGVVFKDKVSKYLDLDQD